MNHRYRTCGQEYASLPEALRAAHDARDTGTPLSEIIIERWSPPIEAAGLPGKWLIAETIGPRVTPQAAWS